MKLSQGLFYVFLACCTSGAVQAQTASPAAFAENGTDITQSPGADLARLGELARMPSGCDGICLMPTVAARGVASVTERDVIVFLGQSVATGQGLLIDARPADNRAAGTIPGATHVPLAVLSADNPYQPQILQALGAIATHDGFDFSGAVPVMVFDNGPTDSNAAGMVAALLAAGYPSHKISYYRGGMLVWVALGLSVAETVS